MFQPFILAIGLIPLLFRIGPLVLPETWLEPYGYWSSKDLNLLEGQDKPTTFWRNQGYWRVSLSSDTDYEMGFGFDRQDTDVYPEAAEALAVKLLEFAHVQPGGSVLGKCICQCTNVRS